MQQIGTISNLSEFSLPLFDIFTLCKQLLLLCIKVLLRVEALVGENLHKGLGCADLR